MFGATVDYMLLRLLAHGRNRAREEELEERARASSFTLGDARGYLSKVRDVYFDGRLPIDPNLSYLDIGCGMGRLCLGLAEAGANDVCGIDIVSRHIDEANILAERFGHAGRIKFENVDVNQWETDRKYDVVFVLGAMEHISDPDRFLAGLPRFLKPDGMAFVSHEPFQSPIGDHLRGFFRVQIPWRGLLFSEKALLRLRREFYRPTDPAERLQDIVGGLNKMSYSEFLRYLKQAGLKLDYVNFTPQLKRIPLAHTCLGVLTAVPKVRDYFIIFAYAILRVVGAEASRLVTSCSGGMGGER